MKSGIPRRVRKEQISDAIAKLEADLIRFEARYECASEEALRAVRRGEMKETAEVARWLSAFQDLQRLKEAIAAGAEAGSHTRTT